MNTGLSLAPLFRHTVGFDRFDELFNNALRADQNSTYPPYDIVREGDDRYRIVMAVAGFSDAELTVTTHENELRISARPASAGDDDVTWLHRGIARRAFDRTFRLADHVRVDSARLGDGLLTVSLVREVPEAARPRTIAIESQA